MSAAAAPASRWRGSFNFSARRQAPDPAHLTEGKTQTSLEQVMTTSETSEAAKAVIRRNTEEVQGGGNFEVFEEL